LSGHAAVIDGRIKTDRTERFVRDDYTHQTPAAVTGAVACGVAPVPLLTVYALIFLIHGSVKPVHPPDVGSSTREEFIAGCISAVGLVVLIVSLLWFLNGKRRWPLAIAQLVGLGVFLDFMIDRTKGSPVIPALLVATSVITLVLMFASSSWWWLGRTAPGWVESIERVVLRRRPAEPGDEVEPHTRAADVQARRRYVGRRRTDPPPVIETLDDAFTSPLDVTGDKPAAV
jgi:hypothetical protein